ncbi:hypothetical protein EJB05_49903, partial [Eragrostis curvula]
MSFPPAYGHNNLATAFLLLHTSPSFPKPTIVSLVILSLLHHAVAVAPDHHPPHDAAPSNTLTSLPPRSSALPKGPTDVSSSSTARPHHVAGFSDHRRAPASPSTVSDATTVARRLLHTSAFVARRQEDQVAAAPSPHAAPSPTRRPHARGATRTRDPSFGVTFADLHDACVRHNCRADYFHRLATVLYGQHTGSGYDVYCVVRTTEGSPPILPGSWRAAVASGVGDAARRISTPCGVTTTSGGVTRSAAPSLLNAALPLLAVAFLPRPVAAAVVLSYLPSLVRAGVFQEAFLKLNHATCAVYAYNNNTGAVERARPVPGLRKMCLRPLCLDFDGDADEHPLRRRRSSSWNDPLRIFCAVHSLGEGASSPSIFFPWRNTWCAHLPISNPDAAAASGVDVCHVELAHMDYTEGYYISCPAGDR